MLNSAFNDSFFEILKGRAMAVIADGKVISTLLRGIELPVCCKILIIESFRL